MAKPKETCGPPCKELKEREHAMHLLKLARECTDWECYKRTAKGKPPGKNTCESAAARIIRNDRFKAAMEWHREQAEMAYHATKERQVQRLAARAEHATMGNFAYVKGGKIFINDTVNLTSDVMRGIKTLKDTQHGVEIQVHDGVAAERLLAEITGHKTPEKIETSNADELMRELNEAAATGDQAALEAIKRFLDGDSALTVYQEWKAGKR